MKVVVTGMGIISSLGNSIESVFENLLAGKSGVKIMEEWKQRLEKTNHG